jgi:hypothetical protein
MTKPLGNDRIACAGIFFVAVGLADKMAFLAATGAAMLLLGLLLLVFAAVRPPGPGRDGAAYAVLFTMLGVIAAIAQFLPGPPNPFVAGLVLAAVAALWLAPRIPALARHRLWPAAALLIASHAVFILIVPSPEHQDVYRFLNLGVDALARGQDPYSFVTRTGPEVFKLTYPPAILLLVAPFRLLLGDIRWAYVAAEAATVALLALWLRRRQGGRLWGWQDALILTPLVLPRASQGFYVFSNHEWVLLALAAAAILAASAGRWVVAGVALGLGICSKQYFVVFPALFLLPLVRRRSLLVGGGVAILIALPFLIWDPGNFLFDLRGALTDVPDPDRLTVWAMAKAAGLNLGETGARLLLAAGLGLTAGLAWWSRRRLDRSLMACGLALMLFSLCSPFAAYNYYVYAVVFLTWGLLVREPGVEAGKI